LEPLTQKNGWRTSPVRAEFLIEPAGHAARGLI
jgi:hypothetical protein